MRARWLQKTSLLSYIYNKKQNWKKNHATDNYGSKEKREGKHQKMASVSSHQKETITLQLTGT